MTAKAERDVAVIGGGIGGLTAALAFAQKGSKVRVYEKAAALTEVGAGIQITPNGARALNALGLEKRLEAVGITAQAVAPMDGLTGKMVARFDLSHQNPNYRFYHRSDLIGVLADACLAAGVHFELGRSISDHDDLGAQIVVGASGLHSVQRAALNGSSAPFFTGQVAWRAIVPMTDATPEARIWMLPGRHVVAYPLRDGQLNIVAIQERREWAEEGWHHKDTAESVLAAFEDAAPPLTGVLRRIKKVHRWGLFRHDIAASWQNGHLALVGDAAHPTLPFLAQGANLAIEDAFTLAQMTAQTDDLEAALTEFEALRKPRVTRAIGAANANAVNYHLSGPRRLIAHFALRAAGRLAPNAFINRLNWLYDYDATRPS